MEDDFYTSLVDTDQAYWLGVDRPADDAPWRTDKGREIQDYGVYGKLDKTTPWNANYKTAAGVLTIPDGYWLVTGKNSEWFPTTKMDTDGEETKAMTICTYVCRHYRNFP